MVQFSAEEAVGAILAGAKLVGEAACCEQRNPSGTAVQRPGLPAEPQVEVKNSGCVGEHRNNLTFDRNGMFVNLVVERLAENYGILARGRSYWLVFSLVKPEVHPIKEMKSGPINDKSAIRLVVRSEKDRSSKYALETFHDAVIPLAVFEEVEEVEDLGGCIESHHAAALADGHGCYPDRNEPVLAVREAELRMADDLKEEFPVAPCVGQPI